MNPVILALQFFSVGIFAVMGLLWTVTNLIAAWHPRSTRTDLNLWLNGAVGIGLLALALLLAALYGWVG